MNKRSDSDYFKDKYKAAGEKCFYCDTPTPFEIITIDHLQARSKGHTRKNNRLFACRKCNGIKGSLSIAELYWHCLDKICLILKEVIKSKWIMKQKQLTSFNRLYSIMKKCKNIMNSNFIIKEKF